MTKRFQFPTFDGGLFDLRDADEVPKNGAKRAFSVNMTEGAITGARGTGTAIIASVANIIRWMGSVQPAGSPSGTYIRTFNKDAGNFRAHGDNWFYDHSTDGRVGGVLASSTDYNTSDGSDPRRERMAQVWYGGEHFEVAPASGHNRVTNGTSAKVELDGTVATGSWTITTESGNINEPSTDTGNPGVTYKYCLVFSVLGGLRVLGKLSASYNWNPANQSIRIELPAASGFTSPTTVVDAYLYRLADQKRGGDGKYHLIATMGQAPGTGVTFKQINGIRRAGESTLDSDNLIYDSDYVEFGVSPYEDAVRLPPASLVGLTRFRDMAVGWRVNTAGGATASSLYFSLPRYIQAWPLKVDLEGEIYQAFEQQMALYIFTSVGVYAATGTSAADDLLRWHRIQGAPAPIYGTVARAKGGFIYLARGGFVFLTTDGDVINLTNRIVRVEGSSPNDYLLDPPDVTSSFKRNYVSCASEDIYLCAAASDSLNSGVVYVCDLRDGISRLRWSKLALGISSFYVFPGSGDYPQRIYGAVKNGSTYEIVPLYAGSKASMDYQSGDRVLDTAEPFILRNLLAVYSNASGESVTLTPVLNGTDLTPIVLNTVGDFLKFDKWLPDKRGERLSWKVTGTGTLHKMDTWVDPDRYGR